MVVAINYANDMYRPAQKFNSRRALKFGADKVIEYSPEMLPEDFVEKNQEILRYPRGNGYWIWKPYIIKDALGKVDDGDHVIYTDSGSAFVNKISYLLEMMELEKTDVMCFCLDLIEKKYTKRDAFILMGCDMPQFTDSDQICATYIILKKDKFTCKLIDEYLMYVQDKRIVTDQPNVMGKDDYPEFVENRHDQSVRSLLCKKHGIEPFRDPSQYGKAHSAFDEAVNKRSNYPQVVESHRNPGLRHFYQLEYKRWYRFFRLRSYVARMKKIISATGGK